MIKGTSEQVVIARSEATWQSRNTLEIKSLDCFAALAMTGDQTCSEVPKRSVSRSGAFLGLMFCVCVNAKAISTEECKAHHENLLEVSLAHDADTKLRDSRLLSTHEDFKERFDASAEPATECRQLLFDSIHLVDAYLGSEDSLNMLRSALSSIETQGVATEKHRVAFFQALIGHRRFDEARAFKAKHPSLEVERVPDIVESELEQPAAFRIDAASGGRLVPVSFELDEVRLVAVVHPLCGFSKKALDAIAAADSGIASAHAVYLTPVDQRLYLSELMEWNAAHASVEIFLTNNRADWPFIDHWATPSFYIIRNGQVQAKLIGWPDDAQLAKLSRMIDGVH